MALRAGLILILVLVGLFAWRAWRPMPNAALLAGAVAAAAAVLLLRSPLAWLLAGLLTWGCCWVIRQNRR